jgi:hypothetical protein
VGELLARSHRRVILFFLNLDAAKDVFEAARGEHAEAVRA